MHSVLGSARRNRDGEFPDLVPDEVLLSLYIWGRDEGVRMSEVQCVRWDAGCIDASVDGVEWRLVEAEPMPPEAAA